MTKLHKGQYLRLTESAGTTVIARAGTVWITEQGNRRDVVLRPGQSFTLASRGVTLVEAFTEAAVSFRPWTSHS